MKTDVDPDDVFKRKADDKGQGSAGRAVAGALQERRQYVDASKAP